MIHSLFHLLILIVRSSGVPLRTLRTGTPVLILLVMMTGCERETPPRLIQTEIKEHLIRPGIPSGLLEMAAEAGRLRFQIIFPPSATDASQARMAGTRMPAAVDYVDLLALLQSHQFFSEPSHLQGNRVELKRWWSDGTSDTVTFFADSRQYRAYDDWRRIFSNLASGRPFNHQTADDKLTFTSEAGQE